MIRAIIFTVVFCLAINSAKAEAYTILVWGDSLSAAHGIPTEQGWVALLGERLSKRNIQVVNKSISGETTGNGAARIALSLANINPDLLILELGGNDGLRGLDLAAMQQNLEEMIQLAKDKDVEVLLLGMKIPPNYGRAYADSFHEIFLHLASEYGTALIPFFLEPVALNYDLMQNDGYHPTAAAQLVILHYIWPTISSLLPIAISTE